MWQKVTINTNCIPFYVTLDAWYREVEETKFILLFEKLDYN